MSRMILLKIFHSEEEEVDSQFTPIKQFEKATPQPFDQLSILMLQARVIP